MLYMLDTNIVSDMIRRPSGPAAKRFNRVGQANTAISIIVAAELRFGLLQGASPELSRKVILLLERLAMLPLEPPALLYAEIRTALEQAGTPIGHTDMLIAAHALALGAMLVTANEAEFSRVPGLTIENWLV